MTPMGTMRNRRSRLTLLSVFSGAGGLDLGLEHAGFRVVGCIEADPTARATLQANRPKWPILEPSEVNHLSRHLVPEQVGLQRGELSLLAGGPPCQSFSKAAQWSPNGRRGLRDQRASCLTGFFRLIDAFLPKVVLIENVPGFMAGRTACLSPIKRAFQFINRRSGCGYQLDWRILDAADYGVPQHRRRAIVIAARDGEPFIWPAPTHTVNRVSAWDALCSIPSPVNPRPAAGWLRLLPTIPEGQNYIWHTRRGGGRPLFGYRTRYWTFLLKLAKNRPSWTISAQPGPFTGPFHWDNRPLSIEEQLRLQSLPSSWRVVGSERERLRQVGNAAPPLLAEVIGRAIARQYFGRQYLTPLRMCAPIATEAPPKPARLKRIPREFLGRLGDHADHPGTGRGPRPIAPVGDSRG